MGQPAMVDQELRDENNYTFEGVHGEDDYDLEKYFDDEPGTVSVDAKVIEESVGEERKH